MTDHGPPRPPRTPSRPPAAEPPARPYLLPSPNAATNLVIADIVMRGASSLMREGVERKIAQASHNSADDTDPPSPGRGMMRTLALYGASRLATRSPLGLGLVVGALAVKTLYDIGKARETRQRDEGDAGADSATGAETGPPRPTGKQAAQTRKRALD